VNVNEGTANPASWVVQINNAHNDTFNANNAPAGTILHGLVDGVGGNVAQAFGFSLGCH
jgi:hypothetical protein